jgi:hypothetical protein
LLHHKYFIMDANSSSGNKITGTGSYNWGLGFSWNNDENLLVIYSPRVNNLYYQEFYSRWRGAHGGVIGIQKINSEIPSDFSLSQNYPNPFNPSTNIKYQIAYKSYVILKVYDILGREIATLVNEEQKAGTYETQFSINQFSNNQIPSGVYFYKLFTDGFTETKKMLLIK